MGTRDGIYNFCGGQLVMASLANSVHQSLSEAAWRVREHARVRGNTRVGCAAIGSDEIIYSGCNIEHRFRSHDIHAEVNAISSLVAGGSSGMRAILIAAERERFTPCGSCMDWIFEIGGASCEVIAENRIGQVVGRYVAHELMPYYPY
jgi:cytidine deaminase